MKAEATFNLYPQVVNWDEKYGSFDKEGNRVKIDESKVNDEVKKLEAERRAKHYQRVRIYPSIQEQLDLLYHDMTLGMGDKTGEWYKTVTKVKTDTPKPSE
jgi:hypothetical protein